MKERRRRRRRLEERTNKLKDRLKTGSTIRGMREEK